MPHCLLRVGWSHLCTEQDGMWDKYAHHQQHYLIESNRAVVPEATNPFKPCRHKQQFAQPATSGLQEATLQPYMWPSRPSHEVMHGLEWTP
eukprot:2131059-Amphidinium_carterae.1